MANKMENDIYCGPCASQHLTNNAEIWCPNCDEGLCSSCLKYHNVSKSTRMHKTLTIEKLRTLPNFVRNIDFACSSHSNVLGLYCSSHEKICCMDCVTDDHSKCLGIMSLAKVVQGVKESAFYHSIEKNIEDLTEFTSKLQKNRNENADKLQQEKTLLVEKVKSQRTEISCHLDKLEKDILQKIDTAMTQESQQINEAVSNLQTKIDTLTEYKNQISTIIENATDLQAFLGLKEIDRNIVKTEKDMSNIMEESGMKETSVKFEFSNEIVGLVQDFNLVGSLEIIKVSTDMHFPGTKSQLAKSLSDGQLGVENIKLTCLSKCQIPFGKDINISGCAILADKRVVLVSNSSGESTRGMFIVSETGEYQKQVKCKSNPFGIMVINESDIAVSFYKENSIKVFDSKHFTEKFRLLDGHYFCGLSFVSECLIVSAVRDVGIYFISYNSGKSLKVFPIDIENLSYVHVRGESTIFPDYENHNLHCLNRDGETVWKFSSYDMKGPRNTCTDAVGNIFVAACDSDCIIAVTPDGNYYKKVLGVEDGLKNPKALCYSATTSTLVVVSQRGSVFRYNLSYD